MNKIDELITAIDDMGVWDVDEYGGGRNYIDPVDKQVIIEELEQLRPYVELAEMVLNRKLFHKHAEVWGQFSDEAVELSEQIRRMKKDNYNE